MPSFSNSPWIRAAPQSGLGRDIVRISARTSEGRSAARSAGGSSTSSRKAQRRIPEAEERQDNCVVARLGFAVAAGGEQHGAHLGDRSAGTYGTVLISQRVGGPCQVEACEQQHVRRGGEDH